MEPVRWAWDKRNTYRRAADRGIPVPRTWVPRDVHELGGLPVSYPVAIKPAIKEHFIYHTKAKAWRADDLAQLEARFEKARAFLGEGEVMVQEFIPGDGRHQFAFCSFFKHSRSLGTMVVRRRRQHPAEFGRASTFVETVDLPELESMSVEFLRSIDFYGLAELEYKRDPRDGVFKLLDFNARCWGYHGLGARAGVDFPCAPLSGPRGTRTARAPRRGWRSLDPAGHGPADRRFGDRAAAAYRPRLPSTLAAADVESVFSRDDPLPGLLELALVPYLVRKQGY